MAAPFRLTYCSNVHPTPDQPTLFATLREHTAPVADAASSAGRSFGLGGWWPMTLAGEFASDAGARQRLREELASLSVPLWTLNVFPFGDFHQEVVKTDVYRPDWSREERLQYTRLCAETGASLVERGETLSLSTLPLGYRGPGDPEPDLRMMARNLARCASAFAAIEARTGVRCVLALEPEPNCLLETVADTAAFLERWLFEEGAWTTVPADVLRRHLGVCVDLCHLFVVGEDAVAAMQDLVRRGIALPKVQVSSCLEVRDAAGIDRLLQFAEPRYLHQTMAENGLRSLDLDGVAARRADYERAGRIRTHYHVPLDWDEAGSFGSTQAEVQRVLRALAAGDVFGGGDGDGDGDALPVLEVETYTWSVLGDTFGEQPLADRISRELAWVDRHLRA